MGPASLSARTLHLHLQLPAVPPSLTHSRPAWGWGACVWAPAGGAPVPAAEGAASNACNAWVRALEGGVLVVQSGSACDWGRQRL